MPSLIRIYNDGMGGTDGFDQYCAMLRPKIKMKTWIPKIFCHLLNVCLINSFIIWKSVELPKNTSLPDFCHHFMHELANEYWSEKFKKEEEIIENTKSDFSEKGKRLKQVSKSHFRLVGAQHCPYRQSLVVEGKIAEIVRKKKHYETNKYIRRKCLICKSKTDIFCKTCNVYLHIDDSNGRNCWSVNYHSEKNI